MSLQPGWVDAIAAAVRSGDTEKVEAITGERQRKPFRIDYSRRFESQSRGGKKGGKAKKTRRV